MVWKSKGNASLQTYKSADGRLHSTIYGICECAEDEEMTEKELYDEMKKNYMVPTIDFESNRHPVNQHMVEALRSVGIEDEPWEFIQNFIAEVKSCGFQ